MTTEEEYLFLLKTFIKIVEANKGQQAGTDDRILDAEGLMLKFFGHAASAFYLFRSTTIPEIPASFFDSASINVIGRAALETFLVFHYVFATPTTEEDKDFRYLSWCLAGYLDRQKLPAHSPRAKRLRLEEQNEIKSIRRIITENPMFEDITQKQKGKLLEGGQWRLSSWTDIGKSAGLDDTHARAFYGFLCGYAHSGNLSILQIRQARTVEDQKAICAASPGLIIIAMANMIRAYCTMFPASNDVLFQDADASACVEMWISIGSTSLEDVEVDWVSAGAEFL